jgi:cytochrome b6
LGVYSWLEERLELQYLADDFVSKFVPPHVNLFYCFGGLVFTTFLLPTEVSA